MCERKVIGVSLLFFAFILLTTCQLQLNKAGNGFTLRVLIPGNASDGIKSTPTLASNAKDLSGGTSVTVTIITQTGSTWASSGLISIGGKTSVDYSVVLPPPGVYQVSAQLLDGSGNVISQASTTFTVPSQTNLVVLTMTSAAPLGGGIQLAWSASISGPFTAITNGDYSVPYSNVYSDNTWPQIYYYQITNTSSTESLGVGPATVTNNTGSVFSVNVPPTSPVPPSGTEIFEVQAVYEGGNTYTETVTLKTTSTNPPDQTFTFTVTDFQS